MSTFIRFGAMRLNRSPFWPWNQGERNMRKNYDDWVEQIQASYAEKTQAWNDKYADFLLDKEAWVATVTEQSTHIGDEDVLSNFGSVTQGAIDQAGSDILITDLEGPGSPEELLSEAIAFGAGR